MALQLENVTITVHGRTLIRELSASIEPGHVLAVMGPSGSGKSSLLAWIAGTLEPPFEARGSLRLDGDDLSARPIQQRRIGLLFQDDLLFPHLSVLGNLLFALPAGERSARVHAAETALVEAGLAGFGPRLPSSLSGGRCCVRCWRPLERCCSTNPSRNSTPRCANRCASSRSQP
jgi:putative thiamine transport system ATP-binding protein